MINKGNDIGKEIQEIAPGLGGLGASPRFHVPEGYFEAFPGKLMTHIRETEHRDAVTAELEEVSPLLAAASRRTPFTVPENFFESLIPAAGPAKVVAMPRRPFLQRKWLAAAAIAGVIGLTAVLLTRQPAPESLDQQMAQLSDQEIIDYLQYRTDAFDAESIFANAVLDENSINISDIMLPEELSTEEIDAILEENLLKDVPFN